jgi:hypothetical protein
MTLESTQLLTEMSTGIFMGDKAQPARKACNITVISESIF